MSGQRGVQSHFECADVESHWQVEQIRLREELTRPYEATLHLATVEHADARELLGKPCSFTFERDGFLRTVHGIVTEVRRTRPLHASAEQTGCRVEIRPALALLGQERGSRYFHDKTAIEIVEEVLGRHLRHGREARFDALQGTYAAREYTAQYNESPLDFVHRLLEVEGIGYAFDQSGEREVVVFYDANRAYPELDSMRGATLHFTPVASEALVRQEHVHAFETTSSLRPTRVHVRDHNWTAPAADVSQDEEETEGTAGHDAEVAEHETPLTIGDYQEPQYQAHDARHQAARRREALRHDAHVADAEANVCGVTPGRRATLSGHDHDDGDWLIVSATHELVAGHGEDAATHRCQFRCIPMEAPYRPSRRTPRPTAGRQGAIVVGRTPAGTTDTDPHARVKVQFHWDREGARDEHSSCWLRVAQPWAGPGMGAQFIPRVGQAVLVDFEHGDPDRPFVLASMYDGANHPPMPSEDGATASPTQSGIRTQGPEDPTRHNELRFDDRHGREEIYLRAQFDLREVVEHDHSTTVHADHTNTVDGDDTETIGGNQVLTVRRDRRHTVDEHETVEIGKTRTTDIHEDEIHRAHATRTLEVKAEESYTVKGPRTLRVVGEAQVRHDASRDTRISANDSVRVEGDATRRVLGQYRTHSDGQLQLQQGTTEKVTMDAGIQLDTASFLKMLVPGITVDMREGTVRIEAQTAIELVVGGNTVRIGPEGSVQIAAEQLVSAEAGSGRLGLDSAGASLTGSAVSAVGTSSTEVAGNTVSIN